MHWTTLAQWIASAPYLWGFRGICMGGSIYKIVNEPVCKFPVPVWYNMTDSDKGWETLKSKVRGVFRIEI